MKLKGKSGGEQVKALFTEDLVPIYGSLRIGRLAIMTDIAHV
ncbi:hypothetical protein D082_05510 [Synechocystis sp. PCC 6714]|nr:hypothetical protein D082_05510 [Synechocystis sp. PCC 6714]